VQFSDFWADFLSYIANISGTTETKVGD